MMRSCRVSISAHLPRVISGDLVQLDAIQRGCLGSVPQVSGIIERHAARLGAQSAHPNVLLSLRSAAAERRAAPFRAHPVRTRQLYFELVFARLQRKIELLVLL